jgi:hypothetical protein
VRGIRQNIAQIIVIAGITGVLFAWQSLSLVYDERLNPPGAGILVVVAREGLNFVFPISPILTVFRLLPLFILTLCLGDNMSGDLMLSGIYGFTRGSLRSKWYLTRAAIMAVYSAVFWLCYGLAFATVSAIMSPTVFRLAGYSTFFEVVFLYLAPYTLFSLLWTNLVSLKKNITTACVYAVAFHCICLFSLLSSSDIGSGWGTILNPLVNASYFLWNDGLEGLINSELMPYNFVYWVIMLGVTIGIQQRYYARADILS